MAPLARSLTPLYHQVEQEILRWIEDGRLKPGDRLPTEQQIAADFGVSRITARRALENLAQRGVLYSQQGRGSFVAQGRIREISGFRSFTDDILKRGLQPSSRLVRCALEPAADEVAERLRLAPGDQVYCVERVRLADALPVAYETAYLPERLCPNLDRFNLEVRSLYAILREEYRIFPTWADAEIEASLINATLARHLEMQSGKPVLRAIRVTYSDTFDHIEYVLSVYRGDRFTFSTGRQFIG